MLLSPSPRMRNQFAQEHLYVLPRWTTSGTTTRYVRIGLDKLLQISAIFRLLDSQSTLQVRTRQFMHFLFFSKQLEQAHKPGRGLSWPPSLQSSHMDCNSVHALQMLDSEQLVSIMVPLCFKQFRQLCNWVTSCTSFSIFSSFTSLAVICNPNY